MKYKVIQNLKNELKKMHKNSLLHDTGLDLGHCDIYAEM